MFHLEERGVGGGTHQGPTTRRATIARGRGSRRRTWLSSFGFRIQGSGSRVPGFRISGLGFWVEDFGFRIQGSWVSNYGFWIQGGEGSVFSA